MGTKSLKIMVKNELDVDLSRPNVESNLWRSKVDRFHYPDAYTPKFKEIIPKHTSDLGIINRFGSKSSGVVFIQIDFIHYVVIWAKS